MSLSFEREMRYVVFKLSKLDDKQMGRLNELLNVSGPDGYAFPTVDCVVVENEWPEYEKVWSMTEDRIKGETNND